jgi:multiple sugar transport system substrate-binding protein
MSDSDDVKREEEQGRLSRRDLLKKAGVATAAVGTAGATAPFSFAGPLKYKGRWLSGNLSIIQWVHFVPAYDVWFDQYCKDWGQKNDVQVTVDHINNTLLDTRAAAEVAGQSGHDLFGSLHPLASYEDQVINHASIIQQIEKKVGKYGDLGRLSTYNPKTKKYFAVSDNYVPDPVVWRHDLWNGIGESPYTWDHVRTAAPKLKAIGHPIGIGQSQELDSNMALIAFLMCFGSFIQTASNTPDLNIKKTTDAINFMVDIYKTGESQEIFAWNPASNNQGLISGQLSLIVNAISATRTPEDLNLPFADNLWVWPIPNGPHGRFGLEHVMGCYSIWKFAKNKANASQFLVDLITNYKEATLASKLYNFPSFPGAFPFSQIRKAAAADPHKPHGKYTVLTTIAEKYTHNIGYPGTTNAAVDEIFSKYLIPQMFAQVAQGKMTAAESAKSMHGLFREIFRKWKKRGKV